MSGYDTGYTFVHFNQAEGTIKKFGGRQPQTLVKSIDFLENLNVLDESFFRKIEFVKVCDAFEADDSWEQDVIVFIIDKDEIKNNQIVLREVTFRKPTRQ